MAEKRNDRAYLFVVVSRRVRRAEYARITFVIRFRRRTFLKSLSGAALCYGYLCTRFIARRGKCAARDAENIAHGVGLFGAVGLGAARRARFAMIAIIVCRFRGEHTSYAR